LKIKLIAVSLLISLTAWAFPLHAASAQKQTTLLEAIQITTSSNEQPGTISVEQSTPNRQTIHIDVAKTLYSGRHYSKEEVQDLIIQYSQEYGISADLPLRVANCESGFNSLSKNRGSTASGVFQYLSSTWRNTEAGKNGISVMDADANVHMAIKSIASGGIGNWAASKSCWNK